ncbi:C40 family peptidase, partial [Enterococcus hirae]|uniref:C40 family peptidase n=1 Tax=Enterococcus hirae TaxID=1354 RepID=UPI00288D28A5
IVIPPAIFFYYSTLFDSRFKTLQQNLTQHIPLSEAQAGDLVFFHSTYNAGSYITHVGIYLGNNRMFHAGDPIGYADLTSPYWQQHLVGAGRIKQ